MKLFVHMLFITLISFLFTPGVSAATYYIAPDTDLDGSPPNVQGSDTNNDGLSAGSSLKTFSRAFDIIRSNHTSGNVLNQPVTIILLDGIYLQSFHPLNLEGTASHRLTLKSANDGKAIIDGQYAKRPIILDHWSANDGFVFEGLVARNSSHSVIHVRYGGSNITLRRISAYNASNTKNEHPIWMDATSNVLLEDVVTGGTGRKQVLVYGRSDNVTLRRVFSLHGGWKGGDPSYIPNWWPQADGIEFYGTVGGIITNSTMENVINFGKNTSYGISVAPNRTTISNVNILGSIAVHGGKDIDGTSIGYVDNRCDPSNPVYNGCYPEWTQQCVQCGKNTPGLSIRTGFTFGVWESNGQIFQNNTFQDLLSWGNLGSGLAAGAPWSSSSTNNVLRNVTIKGNNNGIPQTYEPGEQVKSGSLKMTSVTEADIEGYPEHSGKGARLTHRYVNRQLTNQPLWPWPMEERIREEYSRELGIHNFSVTCRIGTIINTQTKTPITNINVDDYCAGTAPPVTPTPVVPTPTQAPTATPDPNTPLSIITPSRYQLGTLTVGAKAYIDRTFTYTSIPSYLLGRPYIQTANDDKQQTGDNFLRFTVSKPSRVYVGMDTRVTPVPTWLASFTQITDTISYDTSSNPFALYIKDVSAGEVILGANNGQSKDTSMYVVVVVPTDAITKPGDTDNDDDVDIFDYNTVLSNFGKSVTGPANGDLDGDNDVDIFDYNAVISNFGI